MGSSPHNIQHHPSRLTAKGAKAYARHIYQNSRTKKEGLFVLVSYCKLEERGGTCLRLQGHR